MILIVDCPRCTPYLGDYTTHSPIFPEGDLEIVERWVRTNSP